MSPGGALPVALLTSLKLANMAGAKKHNVLFSNGFHGYALHVLDRIGALIEQRRFWLPVERTYPLSQME